MVAGVLFHETVVRTRLGR